MILSFSLRFRSLLWSGWRVLFAMGLLASFAHGQFSLQPVDISGFGKDHPIEARVSVGYTSECKGATYFQGGTVHYSDVSYTIHVVGNVTFTNRSPRKTVLIFRDADPTMTQRIAASRQELVSGNFVSGYDGDRMGISNEPKKVSIKDFAVLRPGESHTIPLATDIAASADAANLNKRLHKAGTYWVQLGIDARPDEFYFSSAAETNFKRKWKGIGTLVEFVLSEPFAVNIKLDPNAPVCKE